ncbi:MAG: Hsp70 family protein [Myxococcota bacterium]
MIVGIDLGTTNSVVGVYRDNDVEIFADERGHVLLPSVVALTPSEEIVVGTQARNRRLIDPTRTVVSVKRKMGRATEVALGPRRLSPSQVSSLILKVLVDRAERALGERPTQAIITVPAYFDDAQRQATRDAGEFAGLEVLRLINEPTAAATNYQSGDEETVMVFDLGGGTFDVSVLEREADLLEVLSSHGDTQLGGDDIDAALYRWVLERLGRDGEAIDALPTGRARLEQAVQRAKHGLSEQEEVRMVDPLIVQEGKLLIDLDLVITREELERLATPIVRRTLAKVDVALRDAQLRGPDLDRVLLVGGASKMPLVERMVSEHLDMPALRDLDADLAVAQGAAILGARAAGVAVENILVDITPHTLVAGARDPERGPGFLTAAPIIPRGSVVPTAKTEPFETVRANQSAIVLPVGQGESSDFEDVTFIGDVMLEDLPPSPVGSRVDVTYRLDLSGVLHVEAVHVPSGQRAQTRFSKSPYRLTAREKTRAQVELEELLEAPAERAAPDRSVAEAILKRADRVLERAPGPHADVEAKRDVLKARIRAASTTEDELQQAVDELSDALLDLL